MKGVVTDEAVETTINVRSVSCFMLHGITTSRTGSGLQGLARDITWGQRVCRRSVSYVTLQCGEGSNTMEYISRDDESAQRSDLEDLGGNLCAKCWLGMRGAFHMWLAVHAVSTFHKPGNLESHSHWSTHEGIQHD